mgnify:CR=1 FL=1
MCRGGQRHRRTTWRTARPAGTDLPFFCSDVTPRSLRVPAAPRHPNGATGIFANAGTAGGITNSSTGKIIIDESYTPTDIDNDGDLDGPFAVGSNRVGIATGGAFTGNIVNSGEITIEGNNSAGIRLGGPLTGQAR